MRFRDVLSALALLAAPLATISHTARAQPFQGVYLGGGLGYHSTNDTNASPAPASALGSNGLKLRTYGGFAGVVSLGYGFGNGWRLEIEGSDRANQVGHLSGTPFPTAAGGSMQTYAVMANALFDLDIGSPWIFPYLGGGVGQAWTAMSSMRAGQSTPLFGFQSSDTAAGFAYQAIAGLSFPMPGVPGLSLTAEYRLVAIPNKQIFSGAAAVPGGTVPASLRLSNVIDHNALIGIRYAFGIEGPPLPAPAAAAPAPAAARSFLVFFDWDKSILSDRARQIIREAAENTRKVPVTRIEVTGYADTSGKAAYNQALSLRRAEAVSVQLIKDGVAKGAITVLGLGDTRLLVATGPGVREPQNRRVEIVIR